MDTTTKSSDQTGKNLFEPVCYDPLCGCPSDDPNMTVFSSPATPLTPAVAHTQWCEVTKYFYLSRLLEYFFG